MLGTFQPNTEGYAQFGPGTVTIPADAKAGTYQLFATQNLTPGETYIRGIPSQATIQVISATGAAPVLAGPPPAAGDNHRDRPRGGGDHEHRQPGRSSPWAWPVPPCSSAGPGPSSSPAAARSAPTRAPRR